MPITFNTNNNYSVDIVTEQDVLNPTVIRFSSDTHTPSVQMKKTAAIYQYPLLADIFLTFLFSHHLDLK